MDCIMFKEFSTVPCILGKDKIDLGEDIERPLTHIGEISYRCSDNVQGAGNN